MSEPNRATQLLETRLSEIDEVIERVGKKQRQLEIEAHMDVLRSERKEILEQLNAPILQKIAVRQTISICIIIAFTVVIISTAILSYFTNQISVIVIFLILSLSTLIAEVILIIRTVSTDRQLRH